MRVFYFSKFLFVLWLIFCCGCGSRTENFVEVSRLTSPDGKVDAVLLSGSINATTAEVHELYIVPYQVKVKDDDPVVLGDRFYRFKCFLEGK